MDHFHDSVTVISDMDPYEIDISVLLIFFSRPLCFEKVFEQVRKARPSRLFLYQDGAREGNQKDIDGIVKCREIVKNIDWNCEIHYLYQGKNIGCDPSEYISQKWAFSYVDKCIVLEDDDVPSQSFFSYCKELLEKYENDERINMICGMNNLETFDTPYSYLFTVSGSIWGWASWRRVIDKWEPGYDILDDTYSWKLVSAMLREKGMYKKSRIKTWKKNKSSGVEHYETINGLSQFTSNSLNIVPTKNMIVNIGNTPEGGTHSAGGNETIPKGLRRIYTMNRFEIELPLKHPKYIIDDVEYKKRLYRVMGWGHPMVQLYRRIEKAFLILRYEGMSSVVKKICRYFERGK